MALNLETPPFTTRPLGETFALEVRGLDLSEDLDAAMVETIRKLWDSAGLLVFREQRLSEAAQITFSRHFGNLDVIPERDKHSTKHPEILRVTNVDENGAIMPADGEYRQYFRILTGAWHTDGSYRPIPALATLLHALEVPSAGGETSFADCRSAYAALPDDLRRQCEDRHMVHYYGHTRVVAPGLPRLSFDDLAKYPPVTHPLVRRLSDGSQSLYLSGNVAYYVGGMPIEEGRALHRRLLDWVTQPRFVYKHAWCVGDLIMWDNRRLMHSAQPFDESHERRVMQRTEVKGNEAPHG